MGQISNNTVLWIVRGLLALPLFVACFYVFLFLNEPFLDVLMYFLLVMGIIVLFLISRAQVPESFSNDQHADRYIKDVQVQQVDRDVFTIPIVCPTCKTSLNLNEVKWQDPHTLLCQECHSEIVVTVV